MHALETHLADAASLTEGADGAHVALVARTEGWGMKGGRVQRDTRVGLYISCCLQVVALAEQGQGVGTDTISQFNSHKSKISNTLQLINPLVSICWYDLIYD